jgi:erythronate-4-phosphate dehydrogenase
LKFVVDQNIRAAEQTFGQIGELTRMDGRSIRNSHLQQADALIIRTATRVDEKLLRDTPVGFVGTTSIGTDHLDIRWLVQEGITWANAPGCNADSAAQYTLAMIWLACERLGRKLEELSVGIIGRGNVGSRLQQLLHTLGVRTVANDPPLSEAGESGLVSLQEALNQDIVSLHVPLTREGPHATYRFFDARQLARMPNGALLVNAARGDVVQLEALRNELQAGRLYAALDVWPGEPQIDKALLLATTVATPHIAGYSDDGKRNGTFMVYEAFCNWADLEQESCGPDHREQRLPAVEPGRRGISSALETTCFVERHDHAMSALAGLKKELRPAEFDRLRREYPTRRDFKGWSFDCSCPQTARVLRELGFSPDSTG